MSKNVYLTNDLYVVADDVLRHYYGERVSCEYFVLPDVASVITNDATHHASMTAKKVVVPEGVRELDGSCFMHFEKLEEIILPSTLERIGDYAFHACGLKQITLPDSVLKIGKGFLSKTGVEELTLPRWLPYPDLRMLDGSSVTTLRLTRAQMDRLLLGRVDARVFDRLGLRMQVIDDYP